MISHRDALGFVKAKLGEPAVAKVLNALSDEDRVLATEGIKLVNSWVDVDAHVRLLATILREVGNNQESLLSELGEWIANEQLNGIYKMFLMVVSPEFMLKRSSAIFHNFYDEGAMEVASLAPGKVESTFRGFHEKQRLIELSITGWFAGAAKLSRAKDPRVEIITSLGARKGYFRVRFNYDVAE